MVMNGMIYITERYIKMKDDGCSCLKKFEILLDICF
jgi:hypothetical protein